MTITNADKVHIEHERTCYCYCYAIYKSFCIFFHVKIKNSLFFFFSHSPDSFSIYLRVAFSLCTYLFFRIFNGILQSKWTKGKEMIKGNRRAPLKLMKEKTSFLVCSTSSRTKRNWKCELIRRDAHAKTNHRQKLIRETATKTKSRINDLVYKFSADTRRELWRSKICGLNHARAKRKFYCNFSHFNDSICVLVGTLISVGLNQCVDYIKFFLSHHVLFFFGNKSQWKFTS